MIGQLGLRRPSLSATGIAAAMAAAIVLACSCSVDQVKASGPTQNVSSSTAASTLDAVPDDVPEAQGAAGSVETEIDGSDASVRAVLAQLTIDDAPQRDVPYRRDDWPTWVDITGDGCNARQKALIAQATGPVEVDRSCAVIAGTWTSPYDGVTGSDPSRFHIDHIVPLAEAHRSGGWRWAPEQRRAFANDEQELLVVSVSSNESKSDKGPDRWRPANTGYWCTYATKWVRVKVAYALSATSSERDALGQMLETCGGAQPSPDTSPPTPAAPPTTAGAAPVGPDDVYYANCAAARAVGAAPIHRDQPGYRESLDGDGDGIACE